MSASPALEDQALDEWPIDGTFKWWPVATADKVLCTRAEEAAVESGPLAVIVIDDKSKVFDPRGMAETVRLMQVRSNLSTLLCSQPTQSLFPCAGCRRA